MITVGNKKSHRKRCDTPEKSKPREKVYNYFIPKQGEHVSVCKGNNKCLENLQSLFVVFWWKNLILRLVGALLINEAKEHLITNFLLQLYKLLLITLTNFLLIKANTVEKKQAKSIYLLSPYFTLQRAYDSYTKSVNNPVTIIYYII